MALQPEHPSTAECVEFSGMLGGVSRGLPGSKVQGAGRGAGVGGQGGGMPDERKFKGFLCCGACRRL